MASTRTMLVAAVRGCFTACAQHFRPRFTFDEIPAAAPERTGVGAHVGRIHVRHSAGCPSVEDAHGMLGLHA